MPPQSRPVTAHSTHLLCGHPLHLGRRGAGPGVELVDEEAGELVLGAQLQCTLKVRLSLSGEAADYVRADSHIGHPGNEDSVRLVRSAV